MAIVSHARAQCQYVKTESIAQLVLHVQPSWPEALMRCSKENTSACMLRLMPRMVRCMDVRMVSRVYTKTALWVKISVVVQYAKRLIYSFRVLYNFKGTSSLHFPLQCRGENGWVARPPLLTF